MTDTFTFQGVELPYARFPPPHWDWLNNSERVVEVSIGEYARQGLIGPRLLEVGNVLSQYVGGDGHTIVDKGDCGFGALTIDILDYHPGRTFDLILSLSTIEHIGYDGDEPTDPRKVHAALDHMRDLLAPGGTLIVEFPLGFNRELDRDFSAGVFPVSATFAYLKRVDAENHWEQAAWDDVKDARFGEPFPYANAIVVAWIDALPDARPAPFTPKPGERLDMRRPDLRQYRKLELGVGDQPKLLGKDVLYADIRDCGVRPLVLCDVFAPLPFPTGHFLALESHHTLEHTSWRTADAVLTEWTRVLERDGSMHLVVPNVLHSARRLLANPSDHEAIQLLYGYQDYEQDTNLHRGGFTPPLLEKAMRRAGLGSIKITDIGGCVIGDGQRAR